MKSTGKKESALKTVPGVAAPARGARPKKRQPALSADEHVAGVLSGNRTVLGKTLTLMGSSKVEHRALADEVLARLLPHTGKSIRVAVTGIPGVGKSTFIESLGTMLTAKGHRVAVLAIDPSSEVSGGSILGDKTRMENLARDPRAIVRPSPCGGWMGGVARGTRESILVCEAAGFDVILIETVGVGQTETQAASMVDFFLVLMVAGAGDELQGIKRGILELADAIAINKADGDNVKRAKTARSQFETALHYLRPLTEGWTPKVLACSATEGSGIGELWDAILEHRKHLERTGQLEPKRSRQALYWMKQAIEHYLVEGFYRRPEVAARIEEARARVQAGEISPFAAAEMLVNLVPPRGKEETGEGA